MLLNKFESIQCVCVTSANSSYCAVMNAGCVIQWNSCDASSVNAPVPERSNCHWIYCVFGYLHVYKQQEPMNTVDSTHWLTSDKYNSVEYYITIRFRFVTFIDVLVSNQKSEAICPCRFCSMTAEAEEFVYPFPCIPINVR